MPWPSSRGLWGARPRVWGAPATGHARLSSACQRVLPGRSRGAAPFFSENAGRVMESSCILRGAGVSLDPDAEPSRQRARPTRCEAAPPKPEGRKVSRGGFLERRPGTASLCLSFRTPTRGAVWCGVLLGVAFFFGPYRPPPWRYTGQARTSPGTTGFDAVGSWGWWRAEVPGGLVNHPENHKCGLTRVRPRGLIKNQA